MTDEDLGMTPGVVRSLQVSSGLCAQLLRESLTPETYDSLRAVAAFLLEPPFSELAPGPAGVLFEVFAGEGDAVAGAGGAAGAGGEDDFIGPLLKTLHQDYSYLFYMVGQSGASPYESPYRTVDRTLYGPTTLELRALMARFGVQTAPDCTEPDDHIAFELAFLSELLGRLADALEQGASGVALLDGIHTLLADHLLGFGPVYLEKLAQAARTPFYQAVAHLTQATLAATAETFKTQAAYSVL